MTDEDKKVDESSPIGTIITVGIIISIFIVGLVVYNVVSAPYHMADELRDRVDMQNNVTVDYRQGWLDCVDYYLWLSTGPSNMTNS